MNPLPAVQPFPQVSVPEHNLLPAVNKSFGPGVNNIYGVEDELDKKESDEEDKTVAEPIYSEIATKSTEAEERKYKIENQSTENQLGDREESSPKLPHKKEIDYWQISTREVAQFRPCTETFINRSNMCWTQDLARKQITSTCLMWIKVTDAHYDARLNPTKGCDFLDNYCYNK